MPRRFGLLLLLTAAVVLAVAYVGARIFQVGGTPFSVNLVNAHTAVIVPIPGIPLPKALEPDDRVDLAATPQPTRIAIVGRTLPVGRTYEFVIRRGRTIVTVPVTSVDTSTGTGAQWSAWGFFCFFVLLGGIALLASWRGRDRAAAGLALWAIAFVFADAASLLPLDGGFRLSAQLGSDVLFLLARAGFYMMVESMAGAALTPRVRTIWRGSFLLLLGAGAVVTLGGLLVFVATGWAGFLQPQYQFIYTAGYLVPVALLFVNYRHAIGAQRLRLRWMLWSSVVFVASVFVSDTQLLGFWASIITNNLLLPIAMAGFLYALLRHRVVDVSVVIDHTIVYGGMTAVVVGVLAAVNSLVEHAALGTSASLLLQVIVPLALGIVLSRVRLYLDRIVEQVFFRKKYLAEKALRRFARHCEGYEHIEELLTAATQTLRERQGMPGVAIYLRKGDTYTAACREGEIAYPESVKIDDAAFAAARTGQNEIDLSELHSALGSDGYAFPMTTQSGLQGVLVCANRPGEHYAAEERKLLTQVARQMGAAMFAINAREDRNFIRAVARGVLNPESTRAQALSLETGWVEN